MKTSAKIVVQISFQPFLLGFAWIHRLMEQNPAQPCRAAPIENQLLPGCEYTVWTCVMKTWIHNRRWLQFQLSIYLPGKSNPQPSRSCLVYDVLVISGDGQSPAHQWGVAAGGDIILHGVNHWSVFSTLALHLHRLEWKTRGKHWEYFRMDHSFKQQITQSPDSPSWLIIITPCLYYCRSPPHGLGQWVSAIQQTYGGIGRPSRTMYTSTWQSLSHSV